MIDNKYEVIFWDFDGVIMDSNEVRNRGFEKVLQGFPEKEVQELMGFHKRNGGLSRYTKFRYFFEEVRGREITDEEINNWADKFSEIMLDHLIKPDLLIDETLNYIKKNYKRKIMHIVSGSDQKELRYICEQLDIHKFFDSINGSPTPKIDLVFKILKKNKFDLAKCVLIGDSINDYEAAKTNQINFLPYNNPELEGYLV